MKHGWDAHRADGGPFGCACAICACAICADLLHTYLRLARFTCACAPAVLLEYISVIVLVLFGHADERGFTQKYANARVIALVLAPKFTRNIAFTERVRTRSFGRYFLSVLYATGLPTRSEHGRNRARTRKTAKGPRYIQMR
jgi:hypothetical protein